MRYTYFYKKIRYKLSMDHEFLLPIFHKTKISQKTYYFYILS